MIKAQSVKHTGNWAANQAAKERRIRVFATAYLSINAPLVVMNFTFHVLVIYVGPRFYYIGFGLAFLQVLLRGDITLPVAAC